MLFVLQTARQTAYKR